MKINVQFEDDTENKIVSYFCGPQDSEVYLNQGEIPLDDIRWLEYYNALPEFFQHNLPTPEVSED